MIRRGARQPPADEQAHGEHAAYLAIVARADRSAAADAAAARSGGRPLRASRAYRQKKKVNAGSEADLAIGRLCKVPRRSLSSPGAADRTCHRRPDPAF